MPVHIDLSLCNGCTDTPEGACEEICPGDLLYRDNGKARLREPSECWDCFACVKACPCEALSIGLLLPKSTLRNRLAARIQTEYILWKMYDHRGSIINQCRIPNRITSSDATPGQNNART